MIIFFKGMYLKRLNEIYIPTYVDVTELEEEVFDNHVELSVKDITSTTFVNKVPDLQNSAGVKKGMILKKII